MNSVQATKTVNPIDAVYSIIKRQSGKVTVKELEKEIGSIKEVRYAITRLTLQGRIKRIKGFGSDRIEYFYCDLMP